MKKLVSTILVLIITITTWGQSQIPLYNMNQMVAQANQLNPAFIPEHRLIIGIPGLSSIQFSANAGVSFNSMFSRGSDDSLRFDESGFLDELKDENDVRFDGNVQLIFVGWQKNNNFYTIAFNTRVNAGFTFNKEAAQWLLLGAADPVNQNTNFNIDGFDGRGMAYNELALGFARKVTHNLSAGARIKLLFGGFSYDTQDVNGIISTSIDSVHISNRSFSVRTSGINNPDQVNGFNNAGFGIDLGAQYDFENGLIVSAAINDIGFISWKNDTKEYTINAVNYTFRGFDVLDLITSNSTNNDFVQNEIDSLENLYDPLETTGIKYTTGLTPKIYLGAEYRLLNLHTFGATIYSDIFKGKINPAFGLSYGIKVKRWLNAVTSITYKEGSVDNVGAGLALGLGFFQLHVISESFFQALLPARAERADIRFGMNLAFGNKKPKRARKSKNPQQ